VHVLHEQVPDAVVARAKAALTRRAAPGALAVLSGDTDGEPHRLAFTHPTVSIEVSVVADGDLRAVSVQSRPSLPLAIERDEEPPTGPVPVVEGVPFVALRGDLVRVAAGPALSEWFRL
jgi:hypothetical protein